MPEESVVEEGATKIVEVQHVLMGYANDAIAILPSIVIAAVVFLVFLVLASVLQKVVGKLSAKVTDDASLQSLFGTTTRVIVIVFGVFAAAATVFPGLSAGDLIGVLGLTSVAIGFAFKDIFQNFLAGVLILAQRPFHIGDQIVTNDFEGTVEKINIRSTEIRTYDGQLVILPNGSIYINPVTVRTAFPLRRTTFAAGIGYDEDIDTARQVIYDALADCDDVVDDPAPQVYVSAHDSSSVNFDVRYWTKPQIADVWKAKDEVGTKIKYALDAAGIEIPYPYRTVEFHDLTERGETGGDERAAAE